MINIIKKKEEIHFWTWKYNHYSQNDCIYPLCIQYILSSTDNSQLTLLIHNVLYILFIFKTLYNNLNCCKPKKVGSIKNKITNT